MTSRYKIGKHWRSAGSVFITSSILCLLVSFSGCSEPEKKSQSETVHLPFVQTMEVDLVSDCLLTRRFSGVIKGRRESRLGFNQPGRVKRISVTEGDSVTEGMVIANLNTDSLNAQKKQTLSDKLAADALLNELIAGPRNQEILAAKASVTQLESDFKLAEIRRERNKRLLSTDAISAQEFDNSYYLALSAKGRLEAAKQNLSLLNEGTRKERIEAQKARIAQLVAAIETIDVRISESQITAPYDGIIASRLSDEGEIVSPGTQILTIIETSHLQAWIGVPEKSVKDLKIGQRYSLLSGDSEFKATLVSILPNLNTTTRTRTVILDIPKSSKQVPLASGSIVRLQIQRPSGQTGFWVPSSALTRGEKGLWSAMGVMEDGESSDSYITKRLDIEILHLQSDRALVRGTLENGQKIVSGGLHKLTVGQRVRIGESTK